MRTLFNRLGDWLEATHGPQFELIRHFFRAFFESELLSVPGRLALLIAGALAVIASFGLLLPLMFNHKYHVLNALPTPGLYREAVLADKLLFVCLSMAISGFVTAIQWQSLFPERTDLLILSPLPLRRRQIFTAKFVALLLFVSTFIVATNLLPSASLPGVMDGRWLARQSTWLHMGSHFAACSAAAYFVFFCLVGAQGILMNLLPASLFHRVSLYCQIALLTVLLCIMPLLLWIPDLHALMTTRPAVAFWLPPIWFLGLYESILGTADEFGVQLGNMALAGTTTVLLLAILLYALTYRRQTGRLLDMPHRRRRGRIVKALSGLIRVVLRSAREHAVFSFVGKTLARSRLHKLLLAAFAAVGFAIVADSFTSLYINAHFGHVIPRARDFERAALSAPLIVCFFLLCGLRYLFSIPVEIKANWLFRMTEDEERWPAMQAAGKAFAVFGVVPVLVLTAAPLAVWLGPVVALLHLATVTMLSLLLIEALLWNWEKIPFTCPYLPGKTQITHLILMYWLALSAFAYSTASIELWCLARGSRMLILYGALVLIWFFVHYHRKRVWGRGRFQFDDVPEPDVYTLGLQPE